MTAFTFSVLFALALVLSVLVKLVLASRQIRHVAAHRAQVPADFASRISLAAHQKAADYTVAKARFGVLELAWGALVLLGWTLLGGLDWLNQTLLAALHGGMLQQLALLAAFTLIGGLIDLPFSLYQTFVLEERYGFNKMTFKLWLLDAMKGAVVGALIGLPLAAAVLWLMGAAGAAWWLWAWALLVGFQLLMLIIYPTLIAPIFNKFEPLKDESLASRVRDLMQRSGFKAKGFFVMDGSRRSAHANAYFTGFGASKRVVFFDTLLAKLSTGQVEAVLAHELGHFKHKHVIKRMVIMFGTSLAGFALLGYLTRHVWFYQGLGVTPSLDAPNNALALLLFMLAVPVFSFFLTPLMAQLSRRDEFQADAYAVQQTNAQDLGQALLKLYEDNASTLTPDPLFVKFYYSHPSASERLTRMGFASGVGLGGAPAGARA
jgi:STE24 endopeptidase